VDERWLTRYRRWIYAGGFGVQIGTGFATYIMTAGVYLLAVLAVLPGDPRLGLLAGVVFALVRGAGIGLAATARDPERLQRVMARVDAAGAAAGWLAGPATGAVVAATLAGATLARGGLVRRTVAAS
jgi:hypothetical protein